MKEFTFFWKSGKIEVFEGKTVGKAFKNGGYGQANLGELGFYSEGNNIENYQWNKIHNKWVKVN